MHKEHSTKKSKLTLYIIIALVIGIGVGFILNNSYLKTENLQLTSSEAKLKEIAIAIKSQTDTNSVAYTKLIAERTEQATIKNAVLAVREKKVEPFAIIADIFLRLIKMIVAPLVFTTLVVGVAKLGDIQTVGRIGGKTMLWFISASLLSLTLGMILVNFFQPGIAMQLPVPDAGLDTGIKKTALTLKEFLYHVFPTSVIDSMARNEILQIVVFALFFGVGTAAIGDRGHIVIKAMDAIAHVILKVTGYVMNLAPLAVFGAMTAIIANKVWGY